MVDSEKFKVSMTLSSGVQEEFELKPIPVKSLDITVGDYRDWERQNSKEIDNKSKGISFKGVLNMTVKDLIEELEKVENKDAKVVLNVKNEGYYQDVINIYYDEDEDKFEVF